MSDSNKSIELTDVIADLNISIADMETLRSLNRNQEDRTNLSRAIGQLKAARGCLLQLIKEVVK